MADNIRATPRNEFFGLLSDAMYGGLDWMKDPQRTQQMQGLAGLLESTGLPKTAERLAYGEDLTNINRANMPLLKPETADALLNVAPLAPAVGKTAKGVARMAGSEINAAMMGERGGLLGAVTPQPKSIFIGENAKTWNKVGADKFLKLEKAGVDPVTAWQQTGTFRSPDNKLRQEISDEFAKFKSTKWDTPYKIKSSPDLENIKMSDVESAFSHPELLAAYPELGKANILVNPYLESLGQWNRATPDLGIDVPYMQLNQTLYPGLEKDWLKRMTTPSDPDYWKNQARYAIKEGFTPRAAIKDMRQEIEMTRQKIKDMESGIVPGGPSTALHELQHGVQEIEGFAKGGSPSTVMTKLQQSNPDEYQRLLSSSQNLNDIYDNAYRRIAGEVEARAVQKRRYMNPEERLQKFPLESYDRSVESLLFP
jgi:hypothetical protein